MGGAAKHTAGPATTFPDAPFEVVMNDDDGVNALIATVNADNTDPKQAKADAAFIAEAFTVAHETGLTPRQLAEQRDELLAALKDCLPWVSGNAGHMPAEKLKAIAGRASAAIENVEGRAS